MQELWEAYWADRSEANFNALFNAYKPQMKTHIGHLLRKHKPSHSAPFSEDDIANEAQRGFANAIRDYNKDRGKSFTSFAIDRSNWLVLNYIDEIHHLKRKQREEKIDIREMSIDSMTPDEFTHKVETIPAFHSDAFDVDFWLKIHFKLKQHPKWRLAMNLVYRENWAILECAKYFQVDRSAIHKWLQAAIEYLKKSEDLKSWLLDEKAIKISDPSRLTKTFKIQNRIAECATIKCSNKVYRRGRCYACWNHLHVKPKIRASSWNGTPDEIMKQMLSSKHKDCTTGLFWQKVFHTCYDDTSGRLILNLIYREEWKLEECAKYFTTTIEEMGQKRDIAVGRLVQSRPFQRWLMSGVQQGFSTKNRNDMFFIPTKDHICASLDCSNKAIVRGRCKSCHSKRYAARDCKHEGCNNPVYCRGFCQPHYQTLLRQGFFLPENSPKCACGRKMGEGLDICFYCVNLKKVNSQRVVKMKDPVYRDSVREMQKKYVRNNPEKVRASHRRCIEKANLKSKIIVLPKRIESDICVATG